LGETDSTYTPPTDVGDRVAYYYVEVTDTNTTVGGVQSAKSVSKTARVAVKDIPSVKCFNADLDKVSETPKNVGDSVDPSAICGAGAWYLAGRSVSVTSPITFSGASVNFYEVADVIEITDQAGLNDIRFNLSGKYILLKDIALIDSGAQSAGFSQDGWAPIGETGGTATSFLGIFNGNDRVIGGLWTSGSGKSNSTGQILSFFGLFGNVGYGAAAITTPAIIKNLTVIIDNAKGGVKGSGSTGGIAGGINFARITNSYVIGDLTSVGNVGGITASAQSSAAKPSQIVDCGFIGNVNGASGVGGIVGSLASGNNLLIDNASVSGSLSAIGSGTIGGILGTLSGGATITNSRNSANVSANGTSVGGIVGKATVTSSELVISNSVNTANVSGSSSVGGIVGEGYGKVTVSNSVNKGNVSGSTNNVGGIAGYIYGNSVANTANITDSYSTGSVSGSQNVGGIAGLVGANGYPYVNITKSYSTGSASASGDYVGGIAGYVRVLAGYGISNAVAINPSVTTSFESAANVNRAIGYIYNSVGSFTNNLVRDALTSGFTNFTDGNEYSGTGKTDIELKTQTTYEAIGWLFGNDDSNPWKIDANKNDGYPYLYWE
jgi:hypothetical protein